MKTRRFEGESIRWLLACSEVEISRGRERKEGHRSTRWCFERESGETTDRISSIAISTRQNQLKTELVGKKWLVGAR